MSADLAGAVEELTARVDALESAMQFILDRMLPLTQRNNALAHETQAAFTRGLAGVLAELEKLKSAVGEQQYRDTDEPWKQ